MFVLVFIVSDKMFELNLCGEFPHIGPRVNVISLQLILVSDSMWIAANFCFVDRRAKSEI